MIRRYIDLGNGRASWLLVAQVEHARLSAVLAERCLGHFGQSSFSPADSGTVATEMVPILRVDDAETTASWYGRFGFEVVGEHRFAPELPLYMFLERDGAHLHLSEHTGDATPNTLVYIYVDDVDALASEFDVAIRVQPWAREIELTDPDGNRLRVGQSPGE